LTGIEIRGCWEAWPAGEARPDAPLTIGPARPAEAPPSLEFVEVDPTGEAADAEITPTDPGPAELAPAAMTPAGEPGWSLWGDPDR
jgi:hypothetical protein